MPRSKIRLTSSDQTTTNRSRWHLPALLLLALVLLVIAYQQMGLMRVVVGPRDLRFVSGTHALEPLEDTGRVMRWTQEYARLDLPLPAAHTPLIFSLNVMNHYPHDFTPPVVDLFLAKRHLLRFTPHPESRHYRLLIPPQERMGWHVPFGIHSTTTRTEIDRRQLGIVLVEAKLIPTGRSLNIPPLWQVSACLIGVAALYTMLRGIGAGRLLAWVGGAVLAIVWTWMLARWPMEIAPYTMRVAGLLCLGALYGVVVKLITLTSYDRSWVSLPNLLLLMGTAYWLMPIYQLIMTADNVEAVSPYPPTMWIGAAMVLAIVVGVAVLTFQGRMAQWRGVVIGALAVASVARLIIMLEFVMSERGVYIEDIAIRGVAALCIAIGFTFVALCSSLRLRYVVLLAVPTLALIISLASLFDPAIGRSGPDFWILFKGSRAWFRGGSMYDLEAVTTNHFGHVFKVPPFYGMLFLPFVTKGGEVILYWHRIMNMILLSVVLLLLVRRWNISLLSVGGAGLLMLLNLRPLADTIAYGQIDIVLLLLLTLALVTSQRGNDGLAGAAVALGTLFKLYPVLLLAFFIAKRQWRALVGFALAMLICNGLALAVVGWEMHRVYLFEVVPRIGGGTAWVENQTLNGFLSRIFAPDVTSSIFEHPLVTLLTYAGFGMATLAAFALAWQPAERDTPRYMLQFGVFVLLMVLVVPAAWMHYQTIVILTMAGVLMYAGEIGLSRWTAALSGLAYALIAYGNQWSYYLNNIMGKLTIIGISYKFYALLLLLAVMVVCLLDRADQPAEAGARGVRRVGLRGVLPWQLKR